jgi:hypothetical protein
MEASVTLAWSFRILKLRVFYCQTKLSKLCKMTMTPCETVTADGDTLIVELDVEIREGTITIVAECEIRPPAAFA